MVLNNCAYLLVTAQDAALRDRDEALQLALKAVALEPTNTAFLDTLAEIQLVRGRVHEARELIDKALLLNPADPYLMAQAERMALVARTGRLARRVYGSLASLEGVELQSGRTMHAALLAFRIRGWDAEQAVDELSRSAFVIADVEPARDAIRVSVGAWNREDELDRFVERVAEMAAHTPATLPRRPSLTVISGPADDR